MTDYGRAIQFGVFLEPATARLDEILALADVADRAGLDLIGIQDQPYQRNYLDTWMLIATVLAAGRDPASIRRIYNLFGSIRERGTGVPAGDGQWTDELTMLAVEHGTDGFVFGPA